MDLRPSPERLRGMAGVPCGSRAVTTRYEITARHPDGRAYLISYSPRLSRGGLLDAMRAQASAIIARLPVSDADELRLVTRPRPFATTGAWWIGFTGRTQIEAQALRDELPWIAADFAA